MDGSLVCGGQVGEDNGLLVCGSTTGNMVGLDDDGWELGVDDNDSCRVDGWNVGSVSVVASSFGFGFYRPLIEVWQVRSVFQQYVNK